MNLRLLEKYLFGRISRNILFWLLFAFFHYTGQHRAVSLYGVMLAVLLVSYAPACYLNNLLLLPRLLMKRRYLAYFSSFVLLLALTTVISYCVTQWSNSTFAGLNYMDSLKNVALPFHAFPSLLMFVMFAAAKFTADAFHNQRKLESLENQRLTSELESLKSQLNPHFLFNSLNTIYGLARRTDHDTAEAVMKLSDILRYVLYDCNMDLVSVEKEIAFLNYFVDFAKLRNNRAKISLDVQADSGDRRIVPLILLPFIENAIRHGLGRHMQNAWVDIRLNLEKNLFYFECSNSNHNKNKFKNEKPAAGGIGLKNVRRRLDLLYNGKHSLEITDNETVFSAKLKIELT